MESNLILKSLITSRYFSIALKCAITRQLQAIINLSRLQKVNFLFCFLLVKNGFSQLMYNLLQFYYQ